MKRIAYALIASTLCGCAVSSKQFYANRYSVSNSEICRATHGAEAKTNYAFSNDLNIEAARRGLSDAACNQIIGSENAAIGVGVLLGVAAIAVARNGGSGGYVGAQKYDSDWDWDEFYGSSGNPVWACRGIQTGQYADQWRCGGKLQIDSRWPDKYAP